MKTYNSSLHYHVEQLAMLLKVPQRRREEILSSYLKAIDHNVLRSAADHLELPGSSVDEELLAKLLDAWSQELTAYTAMLLLSSENLQRLHALLDVIRNCGIANISTALDQEVNYALNALSDIERTLAFA